MNTDMGPMDDRHPTLLELVDYHDGDLDPAAAAHLATCADCDATVATISGDLGAVEPDLPAPFELPTALINLLAAEPGGGPAPDELWLLDWDGVRMLGIVDSADEDPHKWRVIPASIDDELEPDGPMTVDSATSPIGMPLRLWATAAAVVDHGVFLRRSGEIPGVRELLAGPAEAPPSWDAVLVLAEIGHSMETLTSASWLPDTTEELVSVAELMRSRNLLPTAVGAATGIAAARVRDISRGVAQPTATEAGLLGELLDVDPAALRVSTEPPNELVEAVSSPRWRPAIRLRALRDGVSEAAARWSAAADVMALPARTTAGDRDVETWNALLEQYLDGE